MEKDLVLVSIMAYAQRLNEFRVLRAAPMSSLSLKMGCMYEIGELYLTETSQVDYSFTATDSQFSDDALLGFGLLFMLSTLGFFIYFVFMFSVCFYLTSKGSCRRCRRFYFWECLDECPCCDCLVASCNPFDNCCRQSCTSCHKCCNSEACCVCIGSLI